MLTNLIAAEKQHQISQLAFASVHQIPAPITGSDVAMCLVDGNKQSLRGRAVINETEVDAFVDINVLAASLVEMRIRTAGMEEQTLSFDLYAVHDLCTHIMSETGIYLSLNMERLYVGNSES